MSRKEKYVVVTDGADGYTVFLVDRRRNSKRWWERSLTNAMIFFNKDVAERQAGRLTHNNPRVISLTDALDVERKNRMTIFEESVDGIMPTSDDHPFSEEAFNF